MKLDLRRYMAVVVAASIATPALAADDDYFEHPAPVPQAAEAVATPVSYFEDEPAEAPSAAPEATIVDGGHECYRPLSCYLNTKPICNPYQGFYAAVDSTILKPHIGSIGVVGVGTVTPTYDFTYAPRITLGYEGEYGLGARVRYWSLAQQANADTIFGGALTARTQAETLDFEVTQRIVFQKWNFLFGTGIRAANTQNTLTVPGTFQISDNFDGWGANVVLEAYRPIGVTGFSLYGYGRGSLMFGKTSFDLGIGGVLPPTQALTNSDSTFQTYEIGMGLQYKGDVLFGKAGLEAQIWNQGAVAGIIGLDYGYVGPAFSIGAIF